MTESEADTTTKKIKVQKRTPTERQLEALEKARVSKQKKKILKDNAPQSPFLMPSPYLVGTILLGLGGLAAYSCLRPEQSYQTTPETSFKASQPIQLQELAPPIAIPVAKPVAVTPPSVPKPTNTKTQAFFDNAVTI
jgi:hypothetical protein